MTAKIVPFQNRKSREPVCFMRGELNKILNIYGQMVSAGHWRDYAIDMRPDAAIFSIFRHASEQPLYRIEKRPSLRRKQGQWQVIAPGGLIVKRGQELGQVLKVFDKQRFQVLK